MNQKTPLKGVIIGMMMSAILIFFLSVSFIFSKVSITPEISASVSGSSASGSAIKRTQDLPQENTIEILNPQSYSSVGGNWTVKFNTTPLSPEHKVSGSVQANLDCCLINESDSFNFSEELCINPGIDSSLVHLFVVSNESGTCEFGAGYKDCIKAADFCGGAYVNALFKNVSFINDSSSNVANELCGFDTYALNPGEPGSHTRNLYNCNSGDEQVCFSAINPVHKGGGNLINSVLFLKQRVLLFASGLNKSLDDHAAIKGIVHSPYSFSRICLINIVGSISDLTFELSSSLISSKDISDLRGVNCSIIKCSSVSTFSSLSSIDAAFVISPFEVANNSAILMVLNLHEKILEQIEQIKRSEITLNNNYKKEYLNKTKSQKIQKNPFKI